MDMVATMSPFDAPGDWRYDATTMDFMSFDSTLHTPRIRYTMTAVNPDLSAPQMAGFVFSRPAAVKMDRRLANIKEALRASGAYGRSCAAS